MKKILVVGAQGQLGQYLVKSLSSPDIELIGIARNELDLTQLENITSLLSQHAPDVLINASAYTAVDNAESEPELAHLINCDAPGLMADYASSAQIPFIHYSTDYVFAGDAKQPYQEQDNTAPQGQYGATKLAGEQRILNSGAQAYIFRTAWVYSQQGKNFYKTMLQLAETRSELNVVNDQVGSPTYAAAIAEATNEIVAKLIAGQEFSSGVYHMTCAGQTNWAEFAQAIFTLNNKAMTVHGIPSSAYPTPAKRPAYSVLDNEKLRTVFGVELPNWESALQSCVQEGSLSL